jgi:hypothetical protein
VRCSDCGNYFTAAWRWQVRCKPCFAQSKRAELQELREENDWLRAELARLREAASCGGLDRSFVRELVQLCHPDRHSQSELSHKVTAKLLDETWMARRTNR